MPTLEDFQNILNAVEQSRVQQSALYKKAAEAQQQQQEQKQQEEQQMDAFFAQVFERAKRDQRIRQYEEGFRRILHKPQKPDYGIMPLVRACGGAINRFDGGGLVTQEDLDRNGWRWATVDELQEDDPLFKSLDISRGPQWIVDSEGRLVPKSKVETWLNSYERQTPYQVQSDNADDEWVRKRMADRFVGTLGITDWTKPQQRQNFWDLVGYTAEGAGLALGALTLPSAIANGGLGYLSKLGFDIGTGIIGGKGLDKASELTTGKTWGQNVNNLLGINENSTIGNLTNLGYFYGPKAVQYVDQAARASFLDNIVPMGYGNSVSFVAPKNEQFLNFFKDIPKNLANPSRTKDILSGAVNPRWYEDALRTDPESVDDAVELTFLEPQALNNRLNAQRLAIGEYQVGKPTYRSNPDGTVSYQEPVTPSNKDAADALDNYRYHTSIRFNDNVRKAAADNKVINKSYTDLYGLNGGGIGVDHYPDGTSIVTDKWDIQPFKEAERAPFGIFGKAISHIPLIRKMDPVRMMRGPEFTLKQPMDRYGTMIPSSELNPIATPPIYTDMELEYAPFLTAPLYQSWKEANE